MSHISDLFFYDLTFTFMTVRHTRAFHRLFACRAPRGVGLTATLTCTGGNIGRVLAKVRELESWTVSITPLPPSV